MKKKIIFMIINMNIGGTEKALHNMILELSKNNFEITIFMLEKKGGFLESIPKEVKVEYMRNYDEIKDLINLPTKTIFLESIKKGKVIKAFNLGLIHLVSKIKKERSEFYKYILLQHPRIQNIYDVAVAYAGPMDFISYFVINKINAKKKVQWIHFDVTKIGFNIKFASKIYKKFDKIFVVAEEGKKKLLSKLPDLQEKVDTFSNVISPTSIIKLAQSGGGFEDEFSGTRILTVGRLSKEKGQDLIIPVLEKIKKAGYNVRWYCIGDGNARKEYENLVQEYGVLNEFIFLGSIANPYPFMAQCDIYVQPSRHEGYCITLAEAKCFNKPIISTNFTGAREQIVSNQTGIIVNADEEEIYDAVKRLMDDDALRRKLIRNLENNFANNSTSTDIEKLLKIVNH